MTTATIETTLTVPTGRGKLGRGVRWNGSWIEQNSDVEVSIGDVIVVSDKDGEGACVYVAAPVVRWLDGQPGTKLEFWRVNDNGSKKWAASMAADVRRWLALSVDDRCAEAAEMRRGQLVELRDKATATAKGDGTFAFGKTDIPAAEAVARFEAMLAYASLVPVQPTEAQPEMPEVRLVSPILRDSIAQVRALMAELGVTLADLS